MPITTDTAQIVHAVAVEIEAFVYVVTERLET